MAEHTITKFIDQFSTVLTLELSAVGTSAFIAPTQAARLADANTGRGWTLTLDDGAGTFEVVWCTNANPSTGELTLLRGRWNTVAQLWPVGSTIEVRIPSSILNHHMLRMPIAVNWESPSPTYVVNWQEFTSTWLLVGQNVTSLGMGTMDEFTLGMPGLIIHDLLIQQDATGGWTLAWDAGIHWPGGTAPTVTATADRIDIFRLFRASPLMSNWVGVVLGQNIPI